MRDFFTRWFHIIEDRDAGIYGVTLGKDRCFEDSEVWFPEWAFFLFMGRRTFVIGHADTAFL